MFCAHVYKFILDLGHDYIALYMLLYSFCNLILNLAIINIKEQDKFRILSLASFEGLRLLFFNIHLQKKYIDES